MGKAKDHHQFLIAGVGDGVPEAGRDVQRLMCDEGDRLAVGTKLTTAGEDVGDLLDLVRHHPAHRAGGEDGVAEGAGDAGRRLTGEDHTAPASIRERNRRDLVTRNYGDGRLLYNAHLPSFTT